MLCFGCATIWCATSFCSIYIKADSGSRMLKLDVVFLVCDKFDVRQFSVLQLSIRQFGVLQFGV
jgi:hypothetical protein